MSKYIKKDAIVDKVCEGISCNECSFGTNEDGMSECVLQKRIDGLPTADVIEVVRCNDCQYRDEIFDFGRGGCMNPKGLKRIVYEYNYCCHGKRREE